MNANAFRCHLLQQFAATARTQSRPPIALARASSRRSQNCSAVQTNDSSYFWPPQFHSHIRPSVNASVRLEEEAITACETEDSPPVLHPLRGFVRSEGNTQQDVVSPQSSPSQSTILSKESIDQAVIDVLESSRHLFIDGIVFRRLVSRDSIAALADIAYEVTLRRKRLQDPDNAEQFASKKRAKWMSIPTCLVALVENQPPQSTFGHDMFTEMPFVPPGTEQQLEEYAAAYAAVQHLILELHSLGSRAATGPVIRTRAFRELVHVQETDQVVALIMIGRKSNSCGPSKSSQKAMEDLVHDL